MHTLKTASFVRAIFLYAIKIAVFGLAAAAVIYFARPHIISLFAGHNRLVSSGIPVIATAIIFGAIGVALLLATKDKMIYEVVRKIRQKI